LEHDEDGPGSEWLEENEEYVQRIIGSGLEVCQEWTAGKIIRVPQGRFSPFEESYGKHFPRVELPYDVRVLCFMRDSAGTVPNVRIRPPWVGFAKEKVAGKGHEAQKHFIKKYKRYSSTYSQGREYFSDG